jgi:hypothetical protein
LERRLVEQNLGELIKVTLELLLDLRAGVSGVLGLESDGDGGEGGRFSSSANEIDDILLSRNPDGELGK